MTPGARVQAAIDCLDRIIAGAPAEQVLTTWGRQNRYAGSRDRAAVRDHVYGALRRLRSAGWLGSGTTGRAVMIGCLRADGIDPAGLFTGDAYAPAALTGDDAPVADEMPEPVGADLPDWLWAAFRADHGAAAQGIAAALRERAPVFLRARGDRGRVADRLADEGIATVPHPTVATALEVTGQAQKIAASQAYAAGLVELQDASSQAAVLRLPLAPGLRVLDYCAGGGGKALAIAALTGSPVDAHDADPRRMEDIPARAARAGATIRITPRPRGPYDLVLVDAPCSGSGTWRRTPDAKWRLTPARLAELVDLQSQILHAAAALVGPAGWLAYATCSVLAAENAGQVARFTAEGGWVLHDSLQILPGPAGDGFHLSLLRRG